MRKNIFRNHNSHSIVVALLLVAVLCSLACKRKTSFTPIPPYTQGKFETSGDYVYYIDSASVVIAEYLGSSTSLTLPTTYLNKPVAGIGGYDYLFGASTVDSYTHKVPYGKDGRDNVYWIERSPREMNDLPNNKVVRLLKNDSIVFWGTKPRTTNATSGYVSAEYEPDLLWDNLKCFKKLNMSSVTLPASLTYIGVGTFMNNTSLTTINLPAGLQRIGQYAFMKSGITNITLPASVTDIGYGGFYQCANLRSINLPEGVKNIEDLTFALCPNLQSISIPSTVKGIGSQAFDGCTSLANLTLNNGLDYIGFQSFYGCKLLTSVNIPNSVTSIRDYAFQNCTGLTSIVIPNSVKVIGDVGGGSFAGCTNLASVTIGSGVTRMGSNIFSGCSNLRTVSLDMPTIPNSLFYNKGIPITTITLGSHVTSIGDYAFENCTGITSIVIPSSVTSIGNQAFYGCTNLASVTVQATTPPTCGYAVFNSIATTARIKVPAGSVAAYKAAPGWSSYSGQIEGY